MKNLKELLKKAGITQMDLCEALEIKSLSTINLKLNGKSDFSTKEAVALKNLINSRLKSNFSLEDLFSKEC